MRKPCCLQKEIGENGREMVSADNNQGEFMRLLAIRRGRLWSTVESERQRRVKDEGVGGS